MTSLEAMTIVRNAGYTVRFEEGHYVVGIAGMVEWVMGKQEIVALANDLLKLA